MKDSSSDNNPTLEPQPTRKPFRPLRWILLACLAVPTLIALLYAVENFRGARAWSHYRKQAESRGLALDFSAHVPPLIPDADNGALTPWVQSWFPKPFASSDAYWPELKKKAEEHITHRKAGNNRHFTDLVAWKEALQVALTNSAPKAPRGPRKTSPKIAERDRESAEQAAAAPEVLNSLVDYQPAFEELRTASKKPGVRYPIYYNLTEPYSILLPHLSKIRSIVSVLALQSSANLALNKTDVAYNDVLLMLWLTESVRDEPFLINQLVRIACLQMTAQAVWEGVAQQRWSDAQLKEFQARFAKIDFFSSLIRSLNAERAGGLTAIEHMRTPNGRRQLMGANSSGATPDQLALEILWRLAPRGWFRLEAVNYGHAFDSQLTEAFNEEKQTIDKERVTVNTKAHGGNSENERAAFLKHQFATRLLLPAVGTAARKFALGQVLAKEAELACALERYRLAKGKLPDTLEMLVPQFIAKLPRDVLTGEPLRYQHLSDTEFSLSSIGWAKEEVDGTQRSFSAAQVQESTDWTWRSAAP
jgi:hypothetical protein